MSLTARFHSGLACVSRQSLNRSSEVLPPKSCHATIAARSSGMRAVGMSTSISVEQEIPEDEGGEDCRGDNEYRVTQAPHRCTSRRIIARRFDGAELLRQKLARSQSVPLPWYYCFIQVFVICLGPEQEVLTFSSATDVSLETLIHCDKGVGRYHEIPDALVT